ncbi:hypothetical protein QAD02_012798 [Eretmocerus hayati]|uniref:Uncharacterized protein n=1 Tax=Eretmocerus hayati TaxID=131215 RepID=A0ACC2P1S1_9HYME|nr:hypothetical protein QAD02_012798 [Eretmocerus hayati]
MPNDNKRITRSQAQQPKPEAPRKPWIGPGDWPLERLVNAIAFERQLEARRILRKGAPEGSGTFSPAKLQWENVFTCRICDSNNCSDPNCLKKAENKTCEHCGESRHPINLIFKKAEFEAKSQMLCQLRDGAGHTAQRCLGCARCQICEKPGHIAKNCSAEVPEVTPKLVATETCQHRHKLGHTANHCWTLKRLTLPGVRLQNSPQSACQIRNQPGYTAVNCKNFRKKPASDQEVCSYRKKPGHRIAECARKLLSNARVQGNDQNLLKSSGSGESEETRPLDSSRMKTLLGEILPSV